MLKLAMLGADSSHTEAYAELMNPPDAPFHDDAQVVSLWGTDATQAEAKAAACHIPQVAATPTQCLRGVDGVLVVARYGDDHLALAEQALKRGLPTFIDKPLTNDLASARRLAQLSIAHDAPLFSCSPLRYAPEVLTLSATRQREDNTPLISGVVAGLSAYPSLGPRAENVFFYGVHLVELAATQFDIGNVEAVRVERGASADVVALRRTDGGLFSLHFLRECREIYHLSLYTTERAYATSIDAWGPFYLATLERILNFIRGRRALLSLREMLSVIAVLDAIERAYKLGAWVEVEAIA